MEDYNREDSAPEVEVTEPQEQVETTQEYTEPAPETETTESEPEQQNTIELGDDPDQRDLMDLSDEDLKRYKESLKTEEEGEYTEDDADAVAEIQPEDQEATQEPTAEPWQKDYTGKDATGLLTELKNRDKQVYHKEEMVKQQAREVGASRKHVKMLQDMFADPRAARDFFDQHVPKTDDGGEIPTGLTEEEVAEFYDNPEKAMNTWYERRQQAEATRQHLQKQQSVIKFQDLKASAPDLRENGPTIRELMVEDGLSDEMIYDLSQSMGNLTDELVIIFDTYNKRARDRSALNTALAQLEKYKNRSDDVIEKIASTANQRPGVTARTAGGTARTQSYANLDWPELMNMTDAQLAEAKRQLNQ